MRELFHQPIRSSCDRVDLVNDQDVTRNQFDAFKSTDWIIKSIGKREREQLNVRLNTTTGVIK